MNGPLDYSLCDSTVTVYRKQGNTICREVVHNCFFLLQEEQTVELHGLQKETLCFLVMPGQTQRVFPGDRVFEGVGPQVCLEDWENFLPQTVPGLAQISYVKPWFWDGKLCHVEAGRK
jgi:hypothetical protein